jgi:hypothetical protein
MDEGKVLLVNLAKGRVGEETSHLLGGFLMAKLQLAAESRQNIWPPERRRRFYLYVDEFQNYQTSSLPELLAEARGYGLSLVMAHQNLAQLDAELREAIMGNARIRACFRVSYEDAELMTREMFRIRGDRVKRPRADVDQNRESAAPDRLQLQVLLGVGGGKAKPRGPA